LSRDKGLITRTKGNQAENKRESGGSGTLRQREGARHFLRPLSFSADGGTLLRIRQNVRADVFIPSFPAWKNLENARIISSHNQPRIAQQNRPEQSRDNPYRQELTTDLRIFAPLIASRMLHPISGSCRMCSVEL